MLFFIDADVCVYPETVRRVQKTFEADPELTALIGSYDDAPDCQDFLSQYKNLMHCYVHQKSREQATTFWTGCGAIRRPVFLSHSGFNAAHYDRPAIEDIELGYRLFAAGAKMILDRELVVKHLKKWTFWGLLKSDVLDRGIPWTELILRDQNMPNDLNLQLSQRVSVALAFVLLGIGFLLALQWRGYFLIPLFAMVFVILGRYWVEAAQSRNRTVVVFLTLAMSGIVVLSYVHHMIGLAPPILLAYVLLFVRHRYAHRNDRSAKLVASFISLYIGLAVVICLSYFPRNLPILGVFVALVLVIVVLNGQFYLFLAAKQGRLFAVAAIPFHVLYHLYNGLSFSIGAVRHLWRVRWVERGQA